MAPTTPGMNLNNAAVRAVTFFPSLPVRIALDSTQPQRSCGVCFIYDSNVDVHNHRTVRKAL